MKKIMFIFLLLLSSVLLVGCGNDDSNKKSEKVSNPVLVKFLDGYKNKDAKSVCETYMPEMFDSSFDDMNECIESVEDTFYYDIDYAIKEENEMTSDEYEETMHNLVDYYHLSEKKIEKLVLYKVMMTRYYPGTTSGSMGAEDIPMLKYDGKWYILFG